MNTKPYALLSDLHCHNWSSFSRIEKDGMNSRLKITINELFRANGELIKAGGNRMVIAGDIFHVRGPINPEVFNPVQEAFSLISDSGTSIDIIPGNHDLSGKNTTTIGNATQTLSEIENLSVHTKLVTDTEYDYVLVPWEPDLAELRRKIEKYQVKGFDLIMHAGIDGVLTGVPDHGLTSEELAKLSYKRIFAGHYHNHKVMENGKVVSIGATTHQTYSDIGSKAGFLLVYPDSIKYFASHAPNFVEINASTDETEIPMIVDGNYVRVRDIKLTDQQINDLRKGLVDMNAKGVTIEVPRDLVAARTGSKAPVKVRSINESIDAFIDEMKLSKAAEIKKICAEIITEATSAAA